MTLAARCGLSASTLAATSIELVAEHARVEDRGDLADDALVEQALGAAQHLVLADAGRLRHGRERARGQREAALQEVEQLLVEVVERDRRAVLARAGLLPYWSHSATSFAKYVITMSAPARRIAVSDSSTTARSSRYPAAAAALIIEYSPLTL